MTSLERSAQDGPERSVTFERVLGLPSLVAYGLSAMGILTVFTVYGTTSKVSDGHLPASYLVAVIAMLFTAHSYGRLAKAIPSAGSSFAYTSRTFGKVAGFVTGWLMLLDYLFLPMINFLVLGLYLNSVLPGVPVRVFTFAALLLVLAFNLIGVAWVEKLNYFSVGLSVVVGVAFVILTVTHVDSVQPGILVDALVPGSGGMGPIVAGAAVLALAFLGFDGVSTLAEEAKDPARTIPRAIVGATLFVGLFSCAIALAGTLLNPDWTTLTNLDAAGTELMRKVGGAALTGGFLTCYVVGSVLGGTASQMSVSRVLFSMGRDGILPAPIARLHPRFRTPYVAALVVSAFSLIGLYITLDQALYMINFGALVAFAMVNLAVVKHFARSPQRRGPGGAVAYLVLPLIGFGITAYLWTTLAPFTFVLGVAWLVVGLLVYGLRTDWFRTPPPAIRFDDDAPLTDADASPADGVARAQEG